MEDPAEKTRQQEKERRERRRKRRMAKHKKTPPPHVNNDMSSDESMSKEETKMRKIVFATRPLKTVARKGISIVRKYKDWPLHATRHWVLEIGGEYIWELATHGIFKVIKSSCGRINVGSQDWDGPDWYKEDVGYTKLSNNEIKDEAKIIIERMSTEYGTYDSKDNNCQVFVAHLLSLVIDTPEHADKLKKRTGYYTRKVESTIVRLSKRLRLVCKSDTTPSPTSLSNVDQKASIRIDEQGESRDNATKAHPLEASPSQASSKTHNKPLPSLKRDSGGKLKRVP
jgi:hypothetical protein